jgi:hypothetical protein
VGRAGRPGIGSSATWSVSIFRILRSVRLEILRLGDPRRSGMRCFCPPRQARFSTGSEVTICGGRRQANARHLPRRLSSDAACSRPSTSERGTGRRRECGPARRARAAQRLPDQPVRRSGFRPLPGKHAGPNAAVARAPAVPPAARARSWSGRCAGTASFATPAPSPGWPGARSPATP